MAPEYRCCDLLPRCLAMALIELARHVNGPAFPCVLPDQNDAPVPPVRLPAYMDVAESRAGKQCVLIHGRADTVAVALGVNPQAYVRSTRLLVSARLMRTRGSC